MKNKLNLILPAVLTMALFAAACTDKNTDEANKFVDSANKKANEAQAFYSKIPKVANKITNNSEDFEENKKANETEIKEAISATDKYVEMLKSSAGDFREASKLNPDQTFKNYYEAKARQMEGLADIASTQRSMFQDFLDSSDADSANQKMAPKLAKMNDLDKSLTEIENKVTKLEAEVKAKNK